MMKKLLLFNILFALNLGVFYPHDVNNLIYKDYRTLKTSYVEDGTYKLTVTVPRSGYYKICLIPKDSLLYFGDRKKVSPMLQGELIVSNVKSGKVIYEGKINGVNHFNISQDKGYPTSLDSAILALIPVNTLWDGRELEVSYKSHNKEQEEMFPTMSFDLSVRY